MRSKDIWKSVGLILINILLQLKYTLQIMLLLERYYQNSQAFLATTGMNRLNHSPCRK